MVLNEIRLQTEKVYGRMKLKAPEPRALVKQRTSPQKQDAQPIDTNPHVPELHVAGEIEPSSSWSSLDSRIDMRLNASSQVG